MRKPHDLVKHLHATVPGLKRHPDKLRVFVEKGAVATKPGRSSSFEYRYTLQLLVTDFAEPSDALIVPLLAWIEINQPGLITDLDKQDRAIAIEVEIIDHEKVDIALTLELSERVLVTPTAGGWQCEHIGEPELPDLGGPTTWTIFLNGEAIGSGAE